MRGALWGLLLFFGAEATGSANAQSVDTFHGGALINTFAAGVQTTSTKRSNGDEILRIRANSETAQAFIRIKLPPSDAVNGRPYVFWLEVGPPVFTFDKCGFGPSSLPEWSNCFSTMSVQPFGTDLEFIELEKTIPDSLNIGIRFNKRPNIYA